MKYTIQIRGKDLFRFNMQHRYASIHGIMMVLFYALVIFIGVYTLVEKTYKPSYSIMLLVLAGFGVLQPFMLKKRCERAAKTDQFAIPFEFEFAESGFEVRQGEAHRKYNWKEVLGVRETKTALLIYMDKIHALILPKDQLNGETEELMRFIQEHKA